MHQKRVARVTKFVVAAALVLAIGAPVANAAVQTQVGLGTADSFAVLAGTPNITDAGNTSVITGNVGLRPGPGAGIGLLCPQVTGTIYARDATGDPCFTVNDPLLLTAKNDLTTAYNDAAGRTPVTTIPTELGGQTLTPGVYRSASTTFGITAGAGPLILNAQGDPFGVFIFLMNSGATGLAVGPGSVVQLTGSARACNVFWKLNTATIDTTAVFKGTILALTSITVANGANIEGRLLARNGDVTLINDTITRAGCAARPTTPTPSGGVATGGGSTAGVQDVGLLMIGGALLAGAVALFAVRRRKGSSS
jgi:Ice-binding-like